MVDFLGVATTPEIRTPKAFNAKEKGTGDRQKKTPDAAVLFLSSTPHLIWKANSGGPHPRNPLADIERRPAHSYSSIRLVLGSFWQPSSAHKYGGGIRLNSVKIQRGHVERTFLVAPLFPESR